MPEIKAFRAWRYDSARIPKLSAVVAPPYDVISREEQRRLYAAHPQNVIRLEYGREEKKDSAADNRYTRAAGHWSDWKKSGVLLREEKPSLYVYEQDYEEEGKKKSRLGFFAAMRLDESAVLKHENTLLGPKEDRLHLLKAVRANLSPIFGLFEDASGKIQKVLSASCKKRALYDLTVAGVRHRLYREDGEEAVQTIRKALGPKPMFIADGHHRFEVACQYRRWMLSQNGAHGSHPWDYVLAYFSDCRHNPFRIFPTHRLLKLPSGMDAFAALGRLGKTRKAPGLPAVLKELAGTRAESGDKGYSFGFYSKKSGFFLLKLDSKTAGIPKSPVEKLDVSVLHEKIIKPVFGIAAVEKSASIDFTRDAREACQKVNDGEFGLAAFLRPTSLDEMLLVSKKGMKMPQKSTYFYPKLLTGLVMHDVETHD